MAIVRAICTPANVISARTGNSVGFLGNGAERVAAARLLSTRSGFELGPPSFGVSGPNSLLSSEHAELLAMTKWFLSSFLLPSIKHSACATPPRSLRVCVQGHMDPLCVIQMLAANFGDDFFPTVVG